MAVAIGGCGHGFLVPSFMDLDKGQRHVDPPPADEVATCFFCKRQVYWHVIGPVPQAAPMAAAAAAASSPLAAIQQAPRDADENPPHRVRPDSSGPSSSTDADAVIDWGAAVATYNPREAAQMNRAIREYKRAEVRSQASGAGQRAMSSAFITAYAGVTDPTDLDGLEGGTGVGLVGLARGGGGTGAAFTPWVAFSEREAMARARLASLQAGLFRFEARPSGTLNGHAEHFRVFFADALGGRAAAETAVETGSGGCYCDDGVNLYPQFALVAALPSVISALAAKDHSLFGEDGLAAVSASPLEVTTMGTSSCCCHIYIPSFSEPVCVLEHHLPLPSR